LIALRKYEALCALIVFCCGLMPLHGMTASTNRVTRKLGPFTIGNATQMTVYVKITRVHLASANGGWLDSDVSFVVVDTLGRTLFVKRDSADGDHDSRFRCHQINIPTVGAVLVWQLESVPSAPGSGEYTQLLGLNGRRQVMRLSGVLPKSVYKVVFLDAHETDEPRFLDSTVSGAKPYIQIHDWNGYFDVPCFYRIYPNGIAAGNISHPREFYRVRVSIDPKAALKARQRSEEKNVEIQLCKQPRGYGMECGFVTVKVNSTIEFSYAIKLEQWWLEVVLDGQKGFVAEPDFEKLGLQESG